MKVLTLKMKDEEMALVNIVLANSSDRFPASRHRLMKEAMRLGLLEMMRDNNSVHAEDV